MAETQDLFKTVPAEVRRYFEAKRSLPTFDWRDIAPEEHAFSWTVAKSAGFDVLDDIRAAVNEAIVNRVPFEQFQDQLTPVLQAKGWWGRKIVEDPQTGGLEIAQLGSPRRLRTIYWANTRTAYAAGEWDRTQRNKRFLPFLVYGLGELTPYVPNLYELLDQGVRWQRLRGTISAVAMGLAWIGYYADIEEAWTGRRWWNSFQLRFSALPANDNPDLERIEGITGLSVPKRSQLRRGVFGYDVEAAQANHSRHNKSMWNFESGIAVTQAGTLWSFGRSYEFEHVLTEAEGVTIGNWIEPVESGGLKWVDLTVPWVNAHYKWSENPASLRRSVMAGWFANRTLWCRLRDDAGSVIGFRRCRAVRPVNSQFGGAYAHGAISYQPAQAGQLLYVEAMTGFGNANAVTCSHVDLVVGGELAAGVKPGRLWLEPGELLGGTGIAGRAVSIPLRTTVREQFKFLMRF